MPAFLIGNVIGAVGALFVGKGAKNINNTLLIIGAAGALWLFRDQIKDMING